MLWRQPLEDDLGPRRGLGTKRHATPKKGRKNKELWTNVE